MRIFRRRGFLASVLVALALVIGTGLYLVHAQESSRRKLRLDFAARAALAAKLTAGVFQVNTPANVAYAVRTYGGAESTIQAAADADWKTDPGERVIVYGGDGRVLGLAPRSIAGEASSARNEPEVLRALAGRLAFSNVLPDRAGSIVMMAVPYPTPSGPRVWETSIRLSQLASLTTGYLTSSLGIGKGKAFLIDGNGIVIAASASATPGTALRDTALLDAVGNAANGAIAGEDYVSAPVAGTTWRILFVAPTDVLLAAVTSARWLAWQLFGAFALAILGILALAGRAISSSDRLAHERLHDGLTGLPNRALFLTRAEQALIGIRDRSGLLAALFIDLDRFKSINDEYGHAIGDAILKAVAQRLTESVRCGDIVCRYGGDEFLILCTRLADEQQGLELVQRIQRSVTAPYTIGQVELSVGCSIGIAYHVSDAPPLDALSLIGYADLAMYEAKRRGRHPSESARPLRSAI
jgi:diguanylate cyclase (GGDEF)-like protein